MTTSLSIIRSAGAADGHQKPSPAVILYMQTVLMVPVMQLIDKLSVLADAAKYDVSCASSGAPKLSSKAERAQRHRWHGHLPQLYPGWSLRGAVEDPAHQFLPVRLPVLRQSALQRRTRARFTPEEVVELTLDFYRRNCISGLFLSSGIIRSADYTMGSWCGSPAAARRA